MMELSRTQTEIVEMVRDIQASSGDLFGVTTMHLVNALDYDLAKEFLKPDVTREDWVPQFKTREDVIKAAEDYLDFAFEKAANERGLSASRSVDHYGAWVFLACTREEHNEFAEHEYGWYGVAQLMKAAELLGLKSAAEAIAQIKGVVL